MVMKVVVVVVIVVVRKRVGCSGREGGFLYNEGD